MATEKKVDNFLMLEVFICNFHNSIVKLVTMEDNAVLLHESIIRGNHGQKSSRSFRANRFDVDLFADVKALDLNLALV